MCLLEEVGNQFVGIVDCLAIVLLTEEGRHIREKVEGALWLQHLHARDLTSEAKDQVATAMESLAHGFYAVLWTSISRLSRLLCDSSSAANGLTLKAFDSCDEVFVVRSKPSDTIARHGVGLAHTIDDDEAIF